MSDAIKRPAIPSEAGVKDWESLRRFLAPVKTLLEIHEGWRGRPGIDRFVPEGELGNYTQSADMSMSDILSNDTESPGPPTNFMVTAGAWGNNLLSWTNPIDKDLHYIEVYVNTVNSIASGGGAVPAGVVTVNNRQGLNDTFDHWPLMMTVDHYYWIRAVDWSGNYSAWVGDVSGGGNGAVAPGIETYGEAIDTIMTILKGGVGVYADYGPAYAYTPGERVTYLGRVYQNYVACTGVAPDAFADADPALDPSDMRLGKNHWFVVGIVIEGYVDGIPTVGIDGNMVVDGSLMARSIFTDSLSAISANLGLVTAGSIVIGGSNKIWLNDGGDGGLAIGGTNKATAAFRVSSNGKLTIRGSIVQSGDGEYEFPMPCYRGVYSATTDYYRGDVVTYNGNTWMYVNATHGIGHTPQDDAYWDVYVSAGTSVAELAIYKRSDTEVTATPTGGSYNFLTHVLTPPIGWAGSIPAGSAPIYECVAAASMVGTDGIDSTLSWSAPVKTTESGESVDIVFQRAVGQPATPGASSGVPSGWYTNVNSVPVSTLPLWSSVGTRANAGLNWTWQMPVLVEGTPAKYVVITGEQAFRYENGSETPTPSSITLTAALFGGLTGYDWEYWTGSAWSNLSGTNSLSTYGVAYDNAAWGTGNALRIRCLSGTVWDEMTLVKLWDGADGKSIEFIFKTTTTTTAPAKPTSVQADDAVPSGWTDDQSGVTETYKYEWVCKRTKSATGVWGAFSIPAIWATFSDHGYTVILTNEAHTVACDAAGVALAGELGASGRAITDVVVYKKTTGLAPTTSTSPGVGYFYFSISSSVGCTAVKADANTLYLSEVSADSGYVDIAILCESTATSIKKRFSWSKAKAGADGAAGEPGATGAVGPAVTYRGEWLSGRYYQNTAAIRDVVKYGTTWYLCRVSHTSTTSILPDNTAYWEAFGASFTSVATGFLLTDDVYVNKALWFTGGSSKINVTGASGLNINAAGGMTVSSAAGITLNDGGGIKVNSGGDITLIGDDDSPAQLILKDGNGSVFTSMFSGYDGRICFISPSNNNYLQLWIGGADVRPAGVTGNKYQYINFNAYTGVSALHTYSSMVKTMWWKDGALWHIGTCDLGRTGYPWNNAFINKCIQFNAYGASGVHPATPSDKSLIYGYLASTVLKVAVKDTAGNTNVLTPHDFDLFEPDPSHASPWSYSSENEFLGKKINVDMYGAIQAIEELSGKQFIYLADIPRKDWGAHHQAAIDERNKEISDWEALPAAEKSKKSKPQVMVMPEMPKYMEAILDKRSREKVK